MSGYVVLKHRERWLFHGAYLDRDTADDVAREIERQFQMETLVGGVDEVAMFLGKMKATPTTDGAAATPRRNIDGGSAGE